MSPELSKRVATGVIGGAFLLVLIIWGGWPGIFFIALAMALGMAYEYAGIVFQMSDQSEKKYVLLTAIWFIGVASLLAGHAEFEVLIVCFLAYFVYFLFSAPKHVPEGLRTHFQELGLSVLGLVYLGFLPFFLPKIHQSIHGIDWTVTFLLIVFSNDTGGYFAGKKFGKTKLYPVISPKKTREGSYGGLVTGYLLTLFSKAVFFHGMSWAAVIVTPLVVGMTSQVGDLCESMVKRAFDKKDSGSILPGHGGFLDRFDGVVFSLPVMYACVRLLG